jgi:aminoglycoside 6'-N-acetyltransferase
MPPPDAPLTLRPFTAADLPLVGGWLQGDDLRRWWGDPSEQLALLTQDLDEPLMDQQLATLSGQPFGYLQSYPVHAWPAGAPHLADQPQGAVAIDCFVAPDQIGRGLGSAMLRLYAELLMAKGAPSVVIDPDPSNERAVRAYRRAGFTDIGLRPDGEGDLCLVLQFPLAIAL